MTRTQEEEIVTLTTDDRLDLILHHLDRLDRRDRLRTWGGFVHGLLGLIPLVFFVLSVWYVYNHGDELLEKVAQQAAKQAATYTQDESRLMLDRLQESLGGTR